MKCQLFTNAALVSFIILFAVLLQQSISQPIGTQDGDAVSRSNVQYKKRIFASRLMNKWRNQLREQRLPRTKKPCRPAGSWAVC